MLRAYRLPILAGLLIGTSYIPFPPWALFFCLVPLWLFALDAKNWKQAFWAGWITQFILNLIGFHWIAYTAVEFGHLPWWAGGLVLIGFCATAHLYFPVSLVVWYLLENRYRLKRAPSIFLLAALFSFFEMLFPVLFPWHLGYPWLWAGLPGVQVADLIGFQGLNVITIAANAALAMAWLRKNELRERALWSGATIAALLAVNLFGLTRKAEWSQFDAEAKVLTVQGNIGNFEKLMAEKGQTYQQDIVDRYISLSRAGITKYPDSDLILWPETAFPDYLDAAYAAHPHAVAVRTFLKSVKKPLLTGGYSRDISNSQTFNGLFLLDSKGELPLPPYRKTLLLAFGEYFPGADWFPFIMKLFPDLSAFGRGQGPVSMNWGNWSIGPQICYEGLYPWFSRGLSKAGAEIFVNVTNDSWFGTYFQPRQHLYMTFARALEFRRPLVRSTNTGITTAILANGDILEKSPLNREWFGQFKVPFRRNPPRTFYESFEPVWPALIFASMVLLVSLGRSRRESANPS